MTTRSLAGLAAIGGMAVAAVVAVGAPAGASAEPVEISLLTNAIRGGKNEASAIWLEDTVIPGFEAMMEEAGTPVTVTFEGRGVDDEDYKSQLALDMGAGEGPDVVAIDGIWVGEFATAEYIKPLEEVVGPEYADWEGWEQINEAVQANASFDGQLYGIPQGTDGRVIYFNKTLFEEAGLPTDWAPATMDEVLEAARTIKEALPDVTPLQMNAGIAMGEATTMQGVLPLLAAAGAPIYNEDTGMWTGATPALTKVLETYATIYGEEGLGDPELQLLQDGRDQSFEQFANGEIAMLAEGDYFWRSVINPESGNFPMEGRDEVVGWAKIPAYEAGGALGGNDAASMGGGGLWTLNPNTEAPAEAWALMTYLNSYDQVVSGLEGQARITQRADVNEAILGDDPLLEFIATEVLPVNHYRPGFAEYPLVSVALQEATEAIVSGTSVEDAAADYQAAVEDIVGADMVSTEDAPVEAATDDTATGNTATDNTATDDSGATATTGATETTAAG